MKLIALRRLVDARRPLTYGIVQAGEDVPGGVPYIRPSDMDGHNGVRRDALRTTSVEIDEAYRRSRLAEGDVVVSIGPGYGKTMKVGPELVGANLTQGTARVVVADGVDADYLQWALQARTATTYWDAEVAGATFKALNLGPLARTPVPVHDTTKQRGIASYLDRETAQIDALIGKQERLIETLRERRVAKLSEVLGRGGHAAWKLRRLVDPARPMSYGILQAGEPQAEGVPYIGPSDMPGEGVAPQVGALRRTTPEIAAQYRRSVLSDRDVVVSIGPAFGKVAVLTSAHAGANLTQDTVRVACRPGRLVPEYLVHVLGSRQVSNFWRMQIAGATFVRLNLGTLASTPVPLPDVAEQRRLVAEIGNHMAKTDALIAKAEHFVTLARERRSALITAAVTGQIDVRAAA